MEVSKVAPPHISRLNRSGSLPRHGVGDGQHVVGAHARGQQRLVRVAKRGVGEQQPVLGADPCGEPLRPELLQLLARPGRRRFAVRSTTGGTGRRRARRGAACSSRRPGR